MILVLCSCFGDWLGVSLFRGLLVAHCVYHSGVFRGSSYFEFVFRDSEPRLEKSRFLALDMVVALDCHLLPPVVLGAFFYTTLSMQP